MLSKRLFRVLIVMDLLLVAVGVAASVLGEAWLPAPLQAFEQARAEADMTTNDWIVVGVGIPLLIALLVAYIGLLAFWRAARPLYLGTIIVATLLTPFGGPYVTPGWVQALDVASAIITGVVLALIYFSPLSDLYEKREIAA